MDKQKCPECKSSKYTNPNLKMLVNACGHALCENCVEILFARGSGSCPQCRTPLRRGNFRSQLFEDGFVEKELDIRRKLMKDFNLSEDNFKSLSDYNDYLELFETVVFNLVNDIDVEQTKKRIDQFKKEHFDLIKSNRLRRRPELSQLDKIIETETSDSSHYHQQRQQQYNQDSSSSSNGVNHNNNSNNNNNNNSNNNSSSQYNQRQQYSIEELHQLLQPAQLQYAGPSVDLSIKQQLQLEAAAASPSSSSSSSSSSGSSSGSYLTILKSRLPIDYLAAGYSTQLAAVRLLTDAYCDLYYRLPSVCASAAD